MSHFTVLKTRITDTEALVNALADMGFTEVEVHQTPQHLFGYRGDVRPQTAEIIIRRRFVGAASNDIGFTRGEDGHFEAVISRFDRFRYSKKWLKRLTQRYAFHVATAQLVEQGFSVVSEETHQDERIHLVLRRTM